MAGNLEKHQDFVIDIQKAASLMKYGFGSGAHESTGNYTCGAHLCCVSPEGKVSRCGFFEPVGDIDDLRSAWRKLCDEHLWTLDKLECCNCKVILKCRGGCRFRAKQHKDILSPLCHIHGILDFLY